MKTINEVKKENSELLMAMDGVEGVGIGDKEGKPCLRIYISNQDVACRLPTNVDGYEVETIYSGKFVAQ